MSDQEGYKIVRELGVEKVNTLTGDHLDIIKLDEGSSSRYELILMNGDQGSISLGIGAFQTLSKTRDLVTDILLQFYRKGKQRVFDAIREPDFWDSWDLKYLESIKRNIEINIELIQSLKKAVTSGGEQK